VTAVLYLRSLGDQRDAISHLPGRKPGVRHRETKRTHTASVIQAAPGRGTNSLLAWVAVLTTSVAILEALLFLTGLAAGIN
jgi:hypothetical protein